jgi:hypothetical protein
MNTQQSSQFQLLAGINLDSIPASSRLIRITYRNDSNAAKEIGKKLSQGIIVPLISDQDILGAVNSVSMPDTMISWIRGHMEGIQDSIARTAYESGANELLYHSIAMSAINTEIDSRINAEKARAFRLSGDAIGKWFDTYMTQPLSAHFGARLQLPSSDTKITKVILAYKANMVLLAGKSPIPSDKLDNLERALEIGLAAHEHESEHEHITMIEKLHSRITSLRGVSDDDMLSLI